MHTQRVTVRGEEGEEEVGGMVSSGLGPLSQGPMGWTRQLRTQTWMLTGLEAPGPPLGASPAGG